MVEPSRGADSTPIAGEPDAFCVIEDEYGDEQGDEDADEHADLESGAADLGSVGDAPEAGNRRRWFCSPGRGAGTAGVIRASVTDSCGFGTHG